MSIHAQRTQVRRLLDTSSAGDAPTAYYALFHDPARSKLFVQADGSGRATGFVGVFQTGHDLFRPLVTLRCRDAACAAELLDEALTLYRPYILFASLDQRLWVEASLRLENPRLLCIYRLDPRRFEPVINVLVRLRTAPDGTPGAAIGGGDEQAAAGVNWQSPGFAEVYVHTDGPARRQGWGISVVSAVTQAVLRTGRVPLYLVEPDNDASVALAEKLGYVDTGARQVLADVVYQGHPGRVREE
jgi:RimJ/RimL family protein N-acetyltransferase